MSLVTQVFTEKTVAALNEDGFRDRAQVVEMVMKVWNILNIKPPDGHIYLNDPLRQLFRRINDIRFGVLSEFAEVLERMKCGRGAARCKSLTCDTLKGSSELIRELLLSESYSNVLPGVFQSDRLEAEFGLYRFCF